jgi:hypothetical protein
MMDAIQLKLLPQLRELVKENPRSFENNNWRKSWPCKGLRRYETVTAPGAVALSPLLTSTYDARKSQRISFSCLHPHPSMV